MANEGEANAFSIGFVNLDGMKPINDLFGRDGGDRLIQQCSMRLRAAVEPFGFVFRGQTRLGGSGIILFPFPHP